MPRSRRAKIEKLKTVQSALNIYKVSILLDRGPGKNLQKVEKGRIKNQKCRFV